MKNICELFIVGIPVLVYFFQVPVFRFTFILWMPLCMPSTLAIYWKINPIFFIYRTAMLKKITFYSCCWSTTVILNSSSRITPACISLQTVMSQSPLRRVCHKYRARQRSLSSCKQHILYSPAKNGSSGKTYSLTIILFSGSHYSFKFPLPISVP